MKKTILSLTIVLASALFCHAQEFDLVGRKIINGNFSFAYISPKNSKTNSGAIDASILIGKIKPNLTYLSFGGKLLKLFDVTPLYVGPSIEYGKFVKLVDKLYLAPYVGGSVQGIFDDKFGVSVSGQASPFRFVYGITHHLMLSAAFGSASLQFQRYNGSTSLGLGASMTNNSSFGAFYTFK